jgi:uncharacterized protein YjiS (DUF1127 family)
MTVKGERDCPVTGCTNERKPQYMMCLRHWRRVPRLLNHAVYDSYNWHQRRRTVEALRAYRAARFAAIEAVCLKEHVAVPESERA